MKGFKTIGPLVSILCFVAIAFTACQEGNNVDKHINAYKKAMSYGDYKAGAQSLMYIVAEGPEYKTWRDTLMNCYILSGQLRSAALIGEELLSENASDTAALKVMALAYKKANNQAKVLEYYSKLYQFYPNEHYFAYEMLSAQYNLGRIKEAITNANVLLQKEGIAETKVNLIFDNQNQEVRMDAALYNMQGVILKDVNDKENSIKAFNKALELAPDFLLAKMNLEALN